MKCLIDQREVKVIDCENCLSDRKADPVCFKRGFVWGVPDESEPRWSLSLEDGRSSKEDISRYYDLKWEGNTHLQPLINVPLICHKQPIPPEIRWSVWERDNFTCRHCGSRKYLSIDHIYPESKGGSLEISNLQTLCKPCNSRKGVKV